MPVTQGCSDEAISERIRHYIKDKGYSQDRAVAAAYSPCPDKKRLATHIRRTGGQLSEAVTTLADVITATDDAGAQVGYVQDWLTELTDLVAQVDPTQPDQGTTNQIAMLEQQIYQAAEQVKQAMTTVCQFTSPTPPPTTTEMAVQAPILSPGY